MKTALRETWEINDGKGREMHDLIAKLYPICRSITGDGLRQTLRILQGHIPLTIHEVPTGTEVLDWTIPKEWNIRDAYIKDEEGNRVVDFRDSNLHVVNYSVPVHETMTLEALRPRLHTLPEQPDLIPYRTSYYNETWGFCLRHNQLEAMEEGTYEVCIDSSLEPGALSYGEYVIPGETDEEVLLSCHTCHPSLCNDNLSGVALCTFLAKQLQERETRYTYRFVLFPVPSGRSPGSPGMRHTPIVSGTDSSSPAWAIRGRSTTSRAAVVMPRSTGSCSTCWRSRGALRRAPVHAVRLRRAAVCSPGFNLPVGSLTRTPHGRFPEYHTSADDLDLVQPDALAKSLERYLDVVRVLEQNRTYVSTNPKGEPQLGRRGLYRAMGGHKDTEDMQMAMLWLLNLSDGSHSLLDVAEYSDLPFDLVCKVADVLHSHDLLIPATRC